MPSSPTLRIRGEAVYFEKLRMPPGSQLQLRLLHGSAVVATQTSWVAGGPYAFSIDVARHLLQHPQCCTLEINLSMPDGSPRFAGTTDLYPEPGQDTADIQTGRIRLFHLGG